MNLTDDFTLKCLCGSPVFLEDICAIYPATLREIVNIGYDTFWQYLQILIAEKPVLDKKEEKEVAAHLAQMGFKLQEQKMKQTEIGLIPDDWEGKNQEKL